VFPGGTVDSGDNATDLWKAYIDLDLVEVSRRFGGGLTGEKALAHGVAAIRETFEEAGVFLGHRSAQDTEGVRKTLGMRLSGGLPEGWLEEMVVSWGWTLAFTKLARWSHWITPAARPKRFDTRFFLAFMPPDQECAPDTRETTHGVWIGPEEALVRNLRGEIPLSPPTLATLHELSQFSDRGSLKKELEFRAWGTPRLPRLVPLTRGALLLLPWDPMYGEEVEVDTENLERATLPIGEPFSRIWFDGKLWRPIP